MIVSSKKLMPKGKYARHTCSLNQTYSGGKDETWIVTVTQNTLYVSADFNKLEIQSLPYKCIWPGAARQNVLDLIFMQCTFRDYPNRKNPHKEKIMGKGIRSQRVGAQMSCYCTEIKSTEEFCAKLSTKCTQLGVSSLSPVNLNVLYFTGGKSGCT